MSSNSTFPAMLLLCFLSCPPVLAQTAKELAEDAAAIEKAKAEALESQLRARQAQLSLEQADRAAALALDTKEQEAAEKQRAPLAAAAKGLSDIALKGAISDVGVTGVAIETSALTYRALLPVTGRIAAEVNDAIPAAARGVLLADDSLFPLLAAYQAAEHSLKTLGGQYKSAVNKAASDFGSLRTTAESGTRSGTAIPLVMEGIAAAASIVQAFKTQMSVVSSSMTVDPLALQAAMVHSWRAAKGQRKDIIVYPGLVAGSATSEIGMLVDQLSSDHDWALALQSDMTSWLKERSVHDAAEAKPKAARGGASDKAASDATALEKKRAVEDITTLLAQLKEIDTRVVQVLNALNATSAQQPVSPLAQLIRVGFSVKELRQGVPVLNLKVVAAGGNSLATNNLFTGAKLFHSGGAVVAYSLVGSDGSVLAANVLDAHTGYVRMPRKTGTGLGNSWDTPKAVADARNGVQNAAPDP
ncbi:hypothetical protein [uncultured Massilia sp.]|uniref:hypothetical protein n=1 Tax=uncultured Massilia sp. TaxID=169973 RepID=UPI0025F39A73|nr:hypothetical protein [uncultured Massilia sp.]